jgi:hypothetical protein
MAWVRAGREVDASPRLAFKLYALYAVVNIAYAKRLGGHMPRPELYPVKKVIGFDRAQLAAIEKWRRRQDPIPSVSEAIRRLAAIGLKGTPKRDAR